MKKLLLICALPAFMANAQLCSDQIEITNPIEQYVFKGDGAVVDARSGLIWQRCSVGQTWDPTNTACSNSPTHYDTWGDAMIAASELSEYNGSDGWRVPNLKELESIIERSCFSPAVNSDVFPSTPNAVFYSSTPDAKVNPDLEGRIIDFTDGSEILRDVNQHRFIRLVREIQQDDF